MSNSISAAEANRRFSKILGAVRDGESYVVTSHGKPVARIVPYEAVEAAGVDEHKATPAQMEARRKLLARLESQPVMNLPPWTREELYER